MRIVALSDTHNQHSKLVVPDGDILIHAGDFCINGTEEEARDFVEWFAKLPHKHKIFIGGNHDYAISNAEWRDAELGHLLSWSRDNGGTLYLEGTTAVCSFYEVLQHPQAWAMTNYTPRKPGSNWNHGTGDLSTQVRIHGAPWRPRPSDWVEGSTMRPRHGARPSAFGVRENLIAGYWDLIPPRLDILVTHVPAADVLDEIAETPTADALRIGCPALRAKLAAQAKGNTAPRLHIFGHVHDPGGQHIVTAEGVRAHNVAICDADYNPTRQPQVIDL